jgi:outer membrane lipoprotein LolB
MFISECMSKIAVSTRGIIFAIAFSIIAAGCAIQAPSTAPASVYKASREFKQTIELAGRLSIQYQKNGKDEALHGNFSWTQTAQNIDVMLSSPLGQTIARIEIGPAGATLTQAGQTSRVAANVDLLTEETLGWPLPISGLRDWLQGFGTDSKGLRFVANPRDPEAKLNTLDGWDIRYASWQDEGGRNRPKRIDIERSTLQAGPVAIRIVIDSWH